MGQRSPRRRISSRTKRRYRAIREFFRKALGNSSQSNIKIGSSIAVNVTDLRHKIVGLEQQLNDVSNHCHQLSSLETSLRHGVDQCEDKSSSRHAINNTTSKSDEKNTNYSTTDIIYKNYETITKQSEISDYAKHHSYSNYYPSNSESHAVMISPKASRHATSARTKKKSTGHVDECDPILLRHREAASEHFNLTSHDSQTERRTSPHSITEHGGSEHRHNRHNKPSEYVVAAALDETRRKKRKGRKSKMSPSLISYEEGLCNKNRNNKVSSQLLDQKYIADIIRKQYRPVKLQHGHRESAASQFSAPICRDHEFTAHKDMKDDPDLSPCHCTNRHRSKHVCDYDVSEMRSICDTRLYSSKRNVRPRRRSRLTQACDDSDLYDLIPVKEKSSPKSRRKFQANLMENGYYPEVPPSPRTLRPRLNLTTQQIVDTDSTIPEKQSERIYILSGQKRAHTDYTENVESNITSYNVLVNSTEGQQKTNSVQIQTNLQPQHDTAINSLQNSNATSEPAHNKDIDKSVNSNQDSVLSDKTDKAMCEIKDILLTFLQEIKKDTSPQAANTSSLSPPKGLILEGETLMSGVFPNGQSFNNYGIGPQACTPPALGTGFVTQFPSPYCYPMLTVCPMHSCPPNGYSAPSAPCACLVGTVNTTENNCNDKNKTDTGLDTSNNMPSKYYETDELIKEIYKFVAQSPITQRKGKKKCLNHQGNTEDHDENVLTSRSLGESERITCRDVKVGTSVKYYSKSCEAISNRGDSRVSHICHASFAQSDTVLEKLSLEAVTSSESEFSAGFTIAKRKKGTLANKIRKFLFKKNKKDSFKELNDSSEEMEVRRSSRARSRPQSPSFRQDMASHVMTHDRTLYQQPARHPPQYNAHYPQECHSPPHETCAFYPHCPLPMHGKTSHEHYPHYPHTPPCCNPHSGYVTPQVPLCLKEIEVKSTGTQSDRKMSLFKKIVMRPKSKRCELPTMCTNPLMTGTDPTTMFSTFYASPPQEMPGLWSDWKKLQVKNQDPRLQQQNPHIYEDTLKFKWKTQQDLAMGDKKMRKGMLQKLFYKKNPFS